MIEFRSIDSYKINIDEMLKYASNYFNKDELNIINEKIVLNDLDVFGVLFNLDNRYLFYKLAEDGYLPFYMEYNESKKIVNEVGNYILFKGDNFATIIDNKDSCEYILSYKDGYVKYNYHDLNNDKLYTFFYKQGMIFDDDKQIIVDDYFDIPDGYCYQNTPKSISSYGYFRQDVSTINPLAILADIDSMVDFFKSYEYYKRRDFPDIELYTKIKNSKNKYIPATITDFCYKNEEGYLKSLKDLNVSYNIPKSLVRFYNGSFEIENILDEMVTKYEELNNSLNKKRV